VVALEWSLHRLSMRYDADPRRGGLVFRKRKRQTGALVLDAIAIGYGCHFSRCSRCVGRLNRVAGKIKKAVYRSSGRRVRGEDDKIPAIKSVAPDVPLDVLRNMDIRVDPWCAPTCAPPNALRIRPAHARTSGTHVSRSDFPSYQGLGPCARHRIATRARICSTDFDTHACGEFEDNAKIARYSDKWYLSPPHRVGY
jgi:hypothetical protein